MIIKKIKMHNFRQFKGDQELEFSCDKYKNVTVLLGDNTFGKTTILQAFNWCLYGVAVFPSDSNPDFLLNLEVAEESVGVMSKQEVKVEIELEHKDKIYNIERSVSYVIRENGDWTDFPAKIVLTYKENGITKAVKEGEEKNVINAILPQSLSGYFFFDTERVADISGRKDLSEAVRGLLGLAQIENARHHLGDMEHKKSVIGQWLNRLDLEGDEKAKTAKKNIDDETEKIECYNERIEGLNSEIDKLALQKNEIERKLRDNESTSELQKRRKECEKEKSEIVESLDDANKTFIKCFYNGLLNYIQLPIKEKVLEIINKKINESNEICKTDVSEKIINSILKNGECICGNKVWKEINGDCSESYKRLVDLLRMIPRYSVEKIINHKEMFERNCKQGEQFYSNIDQIYKRIYKLREKSLNLEDEIERIDSVILKMEDMSEYECEINNIKMQIKRLVEQKEKLNQEIGAAKRNIELAKKIYDNAIPKTSQNKVLINYMAYAEKACKLLDKNYQEKEIQMKNELEQKINSIFNRMYHGQRKVKIDKQYSVSLFSEVNGKEKITGESEGLKRVKNFAFIAGLVALAKEKANFRKEENGITFDNDVYPLVMDAPFSNADEKHIESISVILPEVANQVVMFVMKKDWQYAEPAIADRIGKKCSLHKYTETRTTIEV